MYVDGRKFRWMLTQKRKIENDIDPMRHRMKGMLTLQEDVEQPGHFLQHDLRWLETTTITPEIVREITRRALAAGWDPASRSIPRLNMQRVIVENIFPEFRTV